MVRSQRVRWTMACLARSPTSSPTVMGLCLASRPRTGYTEH